MREAQLKKVVLQTRTFSIENNIQTENFKMIKVRSGLRSMLVIRCGYLWTLIICNLEMDYLTKNVIMYNGLEQNGLFLQKKKC